jgi:hypothetical protein
MQGSNIDEIIGNYCDVKEFKSIYLSYINDKVVVYSSKKKRLFVINVDGYDKFEIMFSSWYGICCLWRIKPVLDFKIPESIGKNTLNKTIWLLWLQGWDDPSCKWLNKQVVESWQLNNPDWNIEYVTLDNLKTYVNDIDYIYDVNKQITTAAKSDIIRLSLLKNHGGVWADATLLCMQPLDHWIEEAMLSSDIWMYHGSGGSMNVEVGPASWFIVSIANGTVITKWKNECDNYWANNNSAANYYWMDELFKKLYKTDESFRDEWLKTPYLSCEAPGQSHCLAHDSRMVNNYQPLKNLFLEQPPYVLKFWSCWNDVYPNVETDQCKQSNGYYAIQMSKRKFIYKHKMT